MKNVRQKKQSKIKTQYTIKETCVQRSHAVSPNYVSSLLRLAMIKYLYAKFKNHHLIKKKIY